MDQDFKPEESVDPAAVAFEALRREVTLLNVALSGLAAERASAPDYSETLSEIAQGVRVAVGRMGKLATSPALAATPAEIARQITAAGDEARRQDRATLHQAQEMLQRAAGDLRGWVDTARSASVQNWRLIQTAMIGLAGGAIIGINLPAVVAKAAPEHWAWPEKWAAHVLQRDMWLSGERMLETADAQRWRNHRVGALVITQNRDTLAKCAGDEERNPKKRRCVIRIPANMADIDQTINARVDGKRSWSPDLPGGKQATSQSTRDRQ